MNHLTQSRCLCCWFSFSFSFLCVFVEVDLLLRRKVTNCAHFHMKANQQKLQKSSRSVWKVSGHKLSPRKHPKDDLAHLCATLVDERDRCKLWLKWVKLSWGSLALTFPVLQTYIFSTRIYNSYYYYYYYYCYCCWITENEKKSQIAILSQRLSIRDKLWNVDVARHPCSRRNLHVSQCHGEEIGHIIPSPLQQPTGRNVIRNPFWPACVKESAGKFVQIWNNTSELQTLCSGTEITTYLCDLPFQSHFFPVQPWLWEKFCGKWRRIE